MEIIIHDKQIVPPDRYEVLLKVRTRANSIFYMIAWLGGETMPVRDSDIVLYQHPSIPPECIDRGSIDYIRGFSWIKNTRCEEIVPPDNNKQAISLLLKK